MGKQLAASDAETRASPVLRWAAPLVAAGAVWLLPLELPTHGLGDLSVFVGTIAGLISRPLQAGAVVLIGVTVAAASGLIPIGAALSGFANPTVWLIVASFLFARGFVLSRLGERIAYALIAALGRSPLRLAYSLALADVAMAPLMASNTARVGGVLFPVARSTAEAFGSRPGPTADRLGAFLLLSLYQTDLVASAMFLTSMAANPLVAEMAYQGAGVEVTWLGWAAAAAVPGALTLAVIPLAVHRLCPPEVADTGPVRDLARERLREMGPMTRREMGMLGVFAAVLSLWVSSPWHDVSTTAAALAGVALLLLLGVLSWDDVVKERGAWDALVWFGGLVMLAGELNRAGLLDALAGYTGSWVAGLAWPGALTGLLLVYYYSHYAFASMTAHVTAMFPAFFALACSLGAPPLLAALSLGFFSNLNAATTHYATGPAPIVFGAGYHSQGRWWRIGFQLSLVHLAIWLGVGFAWWRVIGLW